MYRQTKSTRGRHQRPAKQSHGRLWLERLEDRTLLASTPIMISQNGLGLDSIGAMAVSPDGSRAYLGQRASPDRDRARY